MDLKNTLIIFIIFINYFSFAQDWKVYPYTPTTTPMSQISFSVDEGRHSTQPLEWWYTSGHFTGDTSGKAYSFMLTYFHYPVNFPPFSFDGFRILNITDEATGTFYQDTQPLTYSTLSTTGLDILASIFPFGTEYWRNKEDMSIMPIPFEYELSASSSAASITFNLETVKRPLILGDDGFLNQGLANYTFYYSQTKNNLSGSFTLNGVTENVTGTAWIDRQYGDFNPFTGENYEWFSIQLDNGTDLNLWNIFTASSLIPNDPKYKILSAYVDESQNTQYTTSDFEIERLEYFFTPDNLKSYSKKWRLTSTSKNIDLTITSNHTTSEVNITQLSFRFFEGATTITGTIDGVPVTGVGFAELLHNYENPNVSISNPSSGTYNTASPITWLLNNPDDGRPTKYDLEYSIDNQVTFIPIVSGLTSTSYTWNGTGINNGDAVWFKVKAYSIDNTLKSETISASSSIATLSNNQLSKNIFKFYPNPVEHKLFIEFNQPQANTTFEIIDLNGRIISSQLIENNVTTKEFDTQFLSKGIYFLMMKSNNFQDVIKFIKQ